MKNYRNKTLSDTISTIGSMLLFLLFAGCLLMMIAVAAGTYSRISSNFDRTFGTTASLRYISNKLKSCESVEIVSDGSGLLLKSGGAVDVIYLGSGGLYEKTVLADGAVELTGGDRIFELSSLNVSDTGELYKITVALDGDENSTFIRKG